MQHKDVLAHKYVLLDEGPEGWMGHAVLMQALVVRARCGATGAGHATVLQQ